MNSGIFGKILWIDLSSEIFEIKSIPEQLYRQYLGGYGLGCMLLYTNMQANLEPFDEESLLGFFPGLLTGSVAPFTGRYMVVGKSPLTKTWGDANSGGTFGPEIKKCGFDGIIIKGKADHPVYVSIIEGKREIRDAKNIWGLDIIEADNLVKKEHGPFVKTAGIGIAGEKLCKISGIVNDKGRIAARSGLGALMGSKNLKMIILKGDQKVSIFDKDRFMNLVKNYNSENKIKNMNKISKSLLEKVFGMVKLMRRLKVGMSGPPNLMRSIFRAFGTTMGNTISAETGDSPIKNWKGIGMYDFPYKKSNEISSINIQKYKVREYGCFGCLVQCGAILEVPELNIKETHIPEYETCCAFGSLLLNNDLLSIIKINDLCNRAGIDTISTGATVAFAIDCYENGIINKDDTEGLELKWGNSNDIIELVKRIINREGFGDILADGAEIASQKIGKNSKVHVITSLGSELPMHDPKYINSLAFTYAFDPTPGRHTAASIDFTDTGPLEKFEHKLQMPKGWKKKESKKVEAQVINTAFHQVMSSAGMCLFSTSFGPYPFLDLINALTGWELSIDELLKCGRRIQSLRQSFNLREGIKIAENTLPEIVVGNPPQERGPLKNVTVEYKEFFQKFCENFGWNPQNGFPLKHTLKELDLEFVINDLY